MTRLRSQLASLPVQRLPDPEAARRHARDAWRTHGIVLINPAWLDRQLDRELLITLAVAVHGERA
jgi:hypothetical protein